MKLTLDIPLVPRSGSDFKPGDVARHEASARNLVDRFGREIEQASRLNNVPDFLLKAILLTENEDAIPGIVNYTGATGLGQIKPGSGADYISLANRKKLLTDEKKAVLRRALGSNLDRLLKVDNTDLLGNAEWRGILSPALKNAEFNVMVAALALSLLIREHSTTGTMRTDYISARYNQGYYLLLARKISKTLGTEQLIAKVPSEAKSYIVKMCGRNGWLDILT